MAAARREKGRDVKLDPTGGDFLDPGRIDEVLGVVANLAAEVVELRERVASLEARTGDGVGDALDSAMQERIDAFIARVYAPMR